ncbi:alpha/beta fold hydrolase [Dactylosporangium sp. NPDC005572]|uniref:thioesterase II family protein n=1 Tax=Dactylosporangium sp. NPDC005572 TaxID=3156889 RepID=UPI0033B434B0
MTRSLGWLRQFDAPGRPDAAPLVICPHAGTGAASYRAFSKAFSAYFSVYLLQYPGRQDRLAEPAATSIAELGGASLAEFATSPYHRGRPVTLFGHSMGGIVAFEFARAAEAAGVPVATLAVSAVVAPSQIADLPPHPSEDEEILSRLTALQGTSAEILASREILRMALPVLKADYAAIDAYTCEPDVTVSAPVVALDGDRDPIVSLADLYGWGRHTTAGVSVSLFSGGHFYLNDNVEGIAETLGATAGAEASR